MKKLLVALAAISCMSVAFASSSVNVATANLQCGKVKITPQTRLGQLKNDDTCQMSEDVKSSDGIDVVTITNTDSKKFKCTFRGTKALAKISSTCSPAGIF